MQDAFLLLARGPRRIAAPRDELGNRVFGNATMSELERVLGLLKTDGVIGFMSPRMGKMQCRRLIGARLQDTAIDPLDPLVLERIPLSCRGRWALTGHDPDRGEERTHFLEFLENFEVVADGEVKFEVLLCDEDSSPEVVAVVPSFRAAVIWMREWLKEPLGLIVGLRTDSPADPKLTPTNSNSA